MPNVLIVLEPAHGERAEEFLRDGEPGEQPLEEGCAAAHRAEPAAELGLGGTGRAEEEQVLAAEGCEEEQAHLRLAFDESGF